MASNSHLRRLTRALTLTLLLAALALLASSRGAWRVRAQELSILSAQQAAQQAASEALGVEALRGAEQARTQLEHERRERYSEDFRAAAAAFERNDLAACAALLEALPEELTGWEWSQLDLQLQLRVREVWSAPDDLTALAADRGAERLATGTSAGQVHVWSLTAPDFERPLFELDVEDEVRALALDGERLGILTWSGELLLCDYAAGRVLSRESFEEVPLSLALHAEEGAVVGFEGGGVAWRTPADTWNPLAEHEQDVGAVAISPDGKWLASAGDDGLVQLNGGGLHLEARRLAAHSDWVRSLAFDRTGQRLVSGGDDGRLVVWEVASGERVELLEPAVGSLQVVAFSGAGVSYLSDRARGRIAQGYDVSALDLDIEAWEEFSCLCVEREGESFVFAARGEGLSMWSFDAGPAFARLSLSQDALRSVVQSEDGAFLAAGSLSGEVFVLDGESGAVLNEWSLASGVLTLAFSADGGTLAAGTRAGEVIAWTLASGAELARLQEPRAVASLSLSEDGARALCVGWDGGAGLVELASGYELARAEAPRALILTAAAARSAERYAWVGDAGTLRVWEARSGERRAALRDRQLGRVEALSFSPDARRMGAIASGNELTIYDLEAQTVLARAQDQAQGLSVLDFDQTGERLLTAGTQGRLTIRDADTAQPLLELRGDGDALTSAVFSADGARVLAGTSRGALLIWETDSDALEALRTR